MEHNLEKKKPYSSFQTFFSSQVDEIFLSTPNEIPDFA